MVKGSWLPRGMGWPLSAVLALPVSLGCPHRTGPGRGAGPIRGPGPGALGTIGGQQENSPILQGAPLCPGGHTQAPVSGWHLSPGPHWQDWEQLAPNIPGEQPAGQARRQWG